MGITMNDSEDSIFTKIIKGEIPAHKIYEDEHCIAILDIHPQAEGHSLIIPKQQIDHIWDLPDDIYHHLWDVAKTIETKVKQVFNPPRVGIAVEGFGVPHVHIHIIPLYSVEDFKRSQDVSAEPDHQALARVADKLRLDT